MKYALPSVLLAFLVLAGCERSSELNTPTKAGAVRLDFRPNILWIVAEDLGPYIAAFGDSTVSTPHLDRLAREGVRYANLYSPSGVCAPSRAAIATGMYPTRIGATHMRTGPWYGGRPSDEAIRAYANQMPEGIHAYEALPPPGTRMHSEHLRLAGYFTSNASKMDYQFVAPATAWDENGSEAHWRGRAPGQPFFSIINIGITHESQIWRQRQNSLWVDEDLEVPVPPYLPNSDSSLQDIRIMYSNIKRMDAEVGRLLAELEADALLDSTIVFWYTDHGGPLPRQKRMVFDSGLNAPMIIRFPDGSSAGTTDDQLLSFIDLAPTLLSIAGVAPPDNLDGRAFLGSFQVDRARNYVHGAGDRFDETYDAVRAVRDARFKYIRHLFPEDPYFVPVAYRENMPIMRELHRLAAADALTPAQSLWFAENRPAEQLFDTEADPHELSDLAGDPEYGTYLERLRHEADRWMEDTGDMGLIPEQEYIEAIWPGGQQPVTDPVQASWRGSTVVLSSDTEGASIGYQLLAEGEMPGDRWNVFGRTIQVPEGTRVVAMAHRIGFKPSQTTEYRRPD